jgi:hypothetical protein
MDYDSDDGEGGGGGPAAASGAPALSPKLQQAFDLVSKASAPAFELVDGAYCLVLKDTMLATYASVLRIEVADDKLYVTCRLPKDGGGACNARMRVDHKGRVEFSNVMSHLRSVHKTFVRPEHKKQTPEEVAASASSSGAATSSGGGAYSDAEISKEKDALLHLIACGGFPVAIVRNAGFMMYQRTMNRPTIALTSMQRYVDRNLAELVETPRDKGLKLLQTPQLVFVDGESLRLTPLLVLATDGWSPQEGTPMVSVYAMGGTEITTFTNDGRVVALRPKSIAVGLCSLPKDMGNEKEDGVVHVPSDLSDLSALSHGKNLARVITAAGLPVANVIATVMDTAAVGPASLRAPDLSGGGIGALGNEGREGIAALRCNQHVFSLAVQDMEEEDAFKGPVDVAVALSTWFRESKSRFGVLLAAQRAAGVDKPLRPLADVRTRFLSKTLVCARIIRLWPFIVDLDPKVFGEKAPAAGFKSPADRFKELRAKVIAEEDALKSIVGLFAPLHEMLPYLGSQTEYTAPLRIPLFAYMRAHTFKYMGIIPEVAARFLRALFRRCGTIAYMALSECPEGVEPPSHKTVEYTTRIKEDSLHNAALYLDPAFGGCFESLGGVKDDATTTFVQLLKAAVDRSSMLEETGSGDVVEVESSPTAGAGAGAGGLGLGGKRARELAAGASAGGSAGKGAGSSTGAGIAVNAGISKYKSYKEEVEAIEARVRPPLQSPASFEEQTRRLLEEAAARWPTSGRKKHRTGAGAGSSGGDPVALLDKYLEEQLQETVEGELVVLDTLQRAWPFYNLADADTLMSTSSFLELAKATTRYAFWPAHRTKLPLLYYCATVLLCLPATSTSCESLHSVAGRLSQGQRASLKPTNIGLFSIGKVLLSRAVAELPLLKAAHDAAVAGGLAGVDDDDLAEAVDARCYF